MLHHLVHVVTLVLNLDFAYSCNFDFDDKLIGLCQPSQRGKWRLTGSSGELEELHEAQPSPFTLFHHHDHFRTVRSWFRGIPTVPVN
jgi:hypothetical protein